MLKTVYACCCATLLLSACGADPRMRTDPQLPAFVNQTTAPTSTFFAEWSEAQQHLASQPIHINAASTDPPRYVAANPGAIEVSPHGVYVIGESDAPFDTLPTNVQLRVSGDPTGIFYYPGCQCYVYGYVNLGSTPHVYVTNSRADRSAAYEFENIILYQLGYDVSAR